MFRYDWTLSVKDYKRNTRKYYWYYIHIDIQNNIKWYNTTVFLFNS
jgi:hypothetical protein